MEGVPVIVVLEDEKPQLLALRAALEGLGEMQAFSDPEAALEYLRVHRVDVAIIDVHMPRFAMNGLEFIRHTREFDQDLCVIIRTGDDSVDVADSAIELRAFRRAIKNKVSVEELRELTRAAIGETRTRRRVSDDAAHAAEAKTQLVKTLGSVEDELTLGDCYKALFQTMRNQLTALGACSEGICMALSEGKVAIATENAGKTRTLVARLLNEMNTFLDGPAGEALRTPTRRGQASVNSVIETLQKRFLGAPIWAAQRKSVAATGLVQDMIISIPGLPLISALRHLLEFALLNSRDGTVIKLNVGCHKSITQSINATPTPKLTLNHRLVNYQNPGICFRVVAPLEGINLESVRQRFHETPEDPRLGNLQMVGLALGDEQVVLTVHESSAQTTVFDLFLPLGR